MARLFQRIARRLRRPRLGLIVAAYDVAPYIDAFFDSIEAQEAGLDRLEIFIVDDGSTDGTWDIIRRRARGFPAPVRYHRQENAGVAAARNAGLARSRADWIGFPDPDDFLSPDYLAHMLEEIDRSEAGGLLAVAANLIYHDEATGEASDTHNLRYRFAGGIRRKRVDDLGRDVLPHTSAVFMRAAAVKSASLQFDPQVRPSYEDAHFMQRLLLRNRDGLVSFLPDPVYHYRRRQDASSAMDGVTRSPDWYAPHIETAYFSLIAEALALHGEVPRFLQAAILTSLMGKLRHILGEKYDPATLSDDGRASFLGAVERLIGHIDREVLTRMRIAGLRELDRAVLTAWFSDDEYRFGKVVLEPQRSEPSEDRYCLTWQTAGPETRRIELLRDGRAVPATYDTTVPHYLFDRPYGRLHEMRVALSPDTTFAVAFDGEPVPIRLAGREVGTYVTGADLAAALAALPA